ncbi:MAG: DUF1552 domain-containing protein [Planctomycetes bacterium]|nr:DUF1552 domain-containing protein [Planctomycetota bacterium]
MPCNPLNRRTFLRSAGVCIGLPLLDAMLPVGLGAQQRAAALQKKRMICIGRGLGLHTPYFFPEQAGRDYQPSRYLRVLQDYRRDFTVFSGMSHRGYPGGHGTEVALLTALPPERIRPGDIRNTVSLDQEVAARIGSETRFAYLSLGGSDMSWNRHGVKIPSESRATQVFRQLFVNGTPQEVARELQRIQNGHSVLDGVREQARALANTLGPADRQRLDLLLTSIREAEQRLQQDAAWVNRPKPRVDAQPYADDYIGPGTGTRMLNRQRQWFDLVHLAIQTDSTRVIGLWLWSHTENLNLEGVGVTHHDASHHGRDEAKINQLALIEEAELRLFAEFLRKMKASTEGDRSLLDQTVVFYASNLGNASAHTCENLPILLAGGGFRHAGHVAYDRTNNTPLSNLFVRMLQQMGIEQRSFGASSGMITDV